ncbi:4Fe-4S binding protein [archaeon]|nr:4Fe-4S binding protein [archaeon]
MPANASAKYNKTSSWRLWKPIIDHSKCIKCKTCFAYCPHGAISWINGKPKIDYTFCKGCLICAEVCPVKCIGKEKEGN